MISIITPVFNGEQYIEECILNVAGQDCAEMEHLIMDGGSKDGTIDIVKKYAAIYPHLRWVSEKDKGQSDAMNKGLAIARGEIIGVLNVDDVYEPGVLNRVVEVFRGLPEPSLVVANCNAWDENGGFITLNRPAHLKLEELLLGPHIHPFPANPSAYFYHRSLHDRIGLYSIEEQYAMDLDFLLRAVNAAHVKHVDETWGNARLFVGCKSYDAMRDGSMMGHIDRLLNKYRTLLPITGRLAIAIKYEYYNNKSMPGRLVRKVVRKILK